MFVLTDWSYLKVFDIQRKISQFPSQVTVHLTSCFANEVILLWNTSFWLLHSNNSVKFCVCVTAHSLDTTTENKQGEYWKNVMTYLITRDCMGHSLIKYLPSATKPDGQVIIW